jgi:hypothetical protein
MHNPDRPYVSQKNLDKAMQMASRTYEELERYRDARWGKGKLKPRYEWKEIEATVHRLLMAERLRDTDARDENKRAELWQRELVRHFAVRKFGNILPHAFPDSDRKLRTISIVAKRLLEKDYAQREKAFLNAAGKVTSPIKD